MKVKICGITNLRDAEAAIAYGADALGFIFAKASPRFIQPNEIRKIISSLPPFVSTVGVFTDATEEALRYAIAECGIDWIQFHGRFSRSLIEAFSERAIQVMVTKDIKALIPSVRAYMLDRSHGGTGWEMAEEVKKVGTIILAGGLTPENVREAIAKVHPYAVDVSSGVEREPGIKDHAKLKRFIEAAKTT